MLFNKFAFKIVNTITGHKIIVLYVGGIRKAEILESTPKTIVYNIF